MDELVRKFHNQLNRKQHDELEGSWLELIDAGLPTNTLVELADVAAREVSRSKAALLLSVLAENLKEKGRYDEQLRVLRRQADFASDDSSLVQELVESIKQVYSGIPELEQLLQKSGLGFGQPLKEALPVFDRYLSFLPGTRVFEADRGPGKVKKLDLLLDRVTVDFDMGAELSWDTAAAARVLRVSPEGGYFSMLARDRRALEALVQSEPGKVVAMYLRDTGQPASVRDLQTGLSQLVRGDDWEAFWNRARKELARNPHVVARTAPSRVFVWSDEAVATEVKREGPEKLKHDFAEEELAQMKAPALDDAYAKLTSFAERKRFIERLPAARPDDWDRIFVRLFGSGRDSRARALIEKELAAQRPDFWRTYLESVLTGYRQNPDAFLWLIEHAAQLEAATPKGLASRALDPFTNLRPTQLESNGCVVTACQDP